MKRLLDIVTIIWIAAFTATFAGGPVGRVADIVCLLAGVVFAVELAVAYRRSENLRTFLKENVGEILLLVPVFRGLRMFRFVRRARKLRRAFVILDNLFEGIDIAMRVKLRVMFGKIRVFISHVHYKLIRIL